MATLEAQDAAARERIIKHMNGDHQDSIQRYLEHRTGASFLQVRNAQMTDISLNGMKVSYAGKEATISFDPPMKSMRDARERLVQMDKDALKALDRSDIYITRFIPPYVHLGHLFNFTQCFLSYIILLRPSSLRPGSLLYDLVLSKFPGFTNFVRIVQPYVIVIMVGIHASETFLMIKKLRKHGLTPFQRLWWLWVGTCFVEGVTSFWRLDGLIDEKKREKEAKKH